MKPVEVTIEVDRPAGEVFAFVADFANNPRWQRGMRECRWTSSPPHGTGSTYEQRARFLGRDVVSTFRVVDHEPGRRVRITSVAGSFPITVTRTVEPIGARRSRVSAVIEGEAGRFFRLAGPLLRPLVARSVRGDYARLRRLLEEHT